MKFVYAVAGFVALAGAGVASADPPAATEAQAPAAVVSASPACSGYDPAPAFPDGASANATQMSSGNEAYTAWGNARLAKLQVCRAEIQAAQALLNANTSSFNQANEELRAATTAWQAEVEEYNARGGRRGR